MIRKNPIVGLIVIIMIILLFYSVKSSDERVAPIKSI